MKDTDIIKDKLNILDVVGSYVKLEKAGKTYKGKSPFTNEKTPSFFVSPEKGFFYCFSSGKGGDIFTFIQEIERVDFRTALRLLADQAGISLQKNNTKKYELAEKQYAILDEATKWYEASLRKNTDVVKYLQERGLSKETIINYRLGFAQDEWQSCYHYLIKRGYTVADITSAGLITSKEGSDRYYDRFRSRVMFPLFDGRSRVVGFSGRIFGNDERSAKYVNSPEGPVFDKSKVLYGYHVAKQAMSKKDRCILVEGQFDVLLAHQAGYTETVALSGTGLTDHHIPMIKRFTDTLVLALDADKAGLKATRRSVMTAYQHGMKVRIVSLPQDTDPADLIVRSSEHWDVCVKDATDYLAYRLEKAAEADMDFDSKEHLMKDDIFEFVARIESAIMQDKALQKIALFLGVSNEAARKDFNQYLDQTKNNNPQPKVKVEQKENNQEPVIDTTAENTNEILSLYAYALEEKKETKNFHLEKKDIEDLYQELYTSSIQDDIKNIEETYKQMHYFVFEHRYQNKPDHFFFETVYTALAEEKIRRIQTASKTLLEQIRKAELAKDVERMKHLMHKHQQLLAVKTTLMNRIQH